MAENENPVVAPTPSARELRRSARLATKGCKTERMPLKERCVGTPRVTMKKPGKVKKPSASIEKHSASTESHSASTENQTEVFDKDCPTLAHHSIAFVFKNIAIITEANNLRVLLGYAQRGLKLYQKSHKDIVFAFKSIEVLSYKKLLLRQEGAKRIEYWDHICFTAKPENSDALPKHFLVELMLSRITGCWNVRRCCTFEPKDDAGLDHGCIICTNDQKIHPGAGEYYAGSVLTCRKA